MRRAGARHAARKNLRKRGGRKEGANEGFKDNDNFVRATGLLLSVFTGRNWLLTKYDYVDRSTTLARIDCS